MMKKVAITFLALWAVALAQSASAGEWVNGRIHLLLTDDTYWGGCMVKMPDYVSTNSCPSTYISFDCQGLIRSKADSRRLFDAAQLAFATDKEVWVYVSEAHKLDGFCFAQRIDIVR